MSRSLIVTVVARDRAGLVARLAEVATHHDANWLDSRMASLAGRFAGIVHLEAEADRHDALAASLSRLDGITVHCESGVDIEAQEPLSPADGASAGSTYRLEIVGLDHPGIVRDISDCLATHGVSIDTLDTEGFDGPMSGERMFRAIATLSLSDSVPIDELRDALETLSHSLVVDAQLIPLDSSAAAVSA